MLEEGSSLRCRGDFAVGGEWSHVEGSNRWAGMIGLWWKGAVSIGGE